MTKRGKRLAPRAITVVEQVDAQFFAEVPEEDVLRLLRGLAQLPGAGAVGVADGRANETHSGSPTDRDDSA